MKLDLIKLKALAIAATPGPWTHRTSDEFGSGVGNKDNEYCVQSNHNHGSKSWSRDIAVAAHAFSYRKDDDAFKNMEFISACSPDVVLRLVEALEEARDSLWFYALPGRYEKVNLTQTYVNAIVEENPGNKARAWLERWGAK